MITQFINHQKMLNLIGKFKKKVVRSRIRGGASVLIYHHIGPKNSFVRNLEISLATETFEKQIQYLTQNYRVIPFSQITQHAKNRNVVAITFDDGYKSIRETALPILEKYQCPFKIYLNSAQVKGELNWLNKLSVLLDRLNADELKVLAQKAISEEVDDICDGVYPYWNFFIPGKTEKVIATEYDKLNFDEDARELYLSENNIREMYCNELIEWGAHGKHHYPLDMLDSMQLEDDILGGYQELKKILTERLNGFAVPFGSAKFRIKRIANVVARIDDIFVTATDERVGSLKVGALPEVARISLYPGVDELKSIFLNRQDLLPVDV